MSSQESRLLARLLDELEASEAAAVDRRRRDDPDTEQSYRRIESTWEGLELPPPPSPDPTAARRWLAAWRRSDAERRFLGSPVTALVTLTAGIVLGLGLGFGITLGGSSGTDASEDVLVAERLVVDDASLSDDYWTLLAEDAP